MENRQAPREASDAGNCVSVLVWLVCIILCMIWFGLNVGFDGVASVIVALVVSAVASVVIAGPVAWIAALVSPREEPLLGGIPQSPTGFPSPQSDAASTRHQAAASLAQPRTTAATPPIDWETQLRRQDPGLHLHLLAFQQVVAERNKYTTNIRRTTVKEVKTYWGHRNQYRHILGDHQHPDYPTVRKEMERYRRAIQELLRIRTEELQADSDGGFRYREDLRTAEGLVEILRDDFDERFREVENE